MAEARRGAGVWIATCLGVGYCPVAPGTAGSAVAVVLMAALGLLPLSRTWYWGLLAGALLSILVVGVWAATEAERFFGRTDPGHVVIDEVAGQMLTLLARPAANWKWLLAGFLLFRFFDIVKPFPARRAERLPGGWGIMTDDVIAGLYGLAALTLIGHWVR